MRPLPDPGEYDEDDEADDYEEEMMIVTSPAIPKGITITSFRVFCVSLAHFLLTNHKIILFLTQKSQKVFVKIVYLQFFAISKTAIKRIKVLESFGRFF